MNFKRDRDYVLHVYGKQSKIYQSFAKLNAQFLRCDAHRNAACCCSAISMAKFRNACACAMQPHVRMNTSSSTLVGYIYDIGHPKRNDVIMRKCDLHAGPRVGCHTASETFSCWRSRLIGCAVWPHITIPQPPSRGEQVAVRRRALSSHAEC